MPPKSFFIFALENLVAVIVVIDLVSLIVVKEVGETELVENERVGEVETIGT